MEHVAAADSIEPVPDMIDMVRDTDYAVTTNLRLRFNGFPGYGLAPTPYTACGDWLIAINPWDGRRGPPSISEQEERLKSWCNAPRTQPHVWSVTSAAVQSLVQSRGQQSQTICSCGVSASGKTHSSQLALHYLMHELPWQRETVGTHSTRRILEISHTVLDSFVSARTLRNPHSSRSARMHEVLVSVRPGKAPEVLGMRVDIFLLERSRVHLRDGNTPCFNIFHELRAAVVGQDGHRALLPSSFQLLADPLEAWEPPRLPLQGRPWQGPEDDSRGAAEEETRRQDFERLLTAMKDLGISEVQQQGLLRMVAASLVLGQLEFGPVEPGAEALHSPKGRPGFECSSVASLLGCPPAKLRQLLESRHIAHSNGSSTTVPLIDTGTNDSTNSSDEQARSPQGATVRPLRVSLSSAQALALRHGLAESLYARAVGFILRRVNELAPPPSQATASGFTGTIATLDLPGLELTTKDSTGAAGLERLISNYADERLQREFSWNVAGWRLAEYKREGVHCDEYIEHAASWSLPTAEGIESVFAALEDERHRGTHGSDAHLLLAVRDEIRRERNQERHRHGLLEEQPKMGTFGPPIGCVSI